jgi:putative transposase
MPRRPRLLLSHAIYHVMTRGNRRVTIFEDDEDRRQFLTILSEVADRYDIQCYAYCLMGTHYHLVIVTPRGNLSDVMRHLNGVFAQATNRRHRRTGHLFEGRFRAFVIQRESYLRRAVRYVVLNPVRARLVPDAAAWPWSSYQPTVGLVAAPDFLNLDWMREVLGGTSRSDAQSRFAQYVSDPVQRSTPINVNAPVFGSEAFQAKVLVSAKRDPTHVPRRWRQVERPALAQLLENCQTSRVQRNDAIWQAHVTHGYHLSEIARVLQLHPSTTSHIVRRRQGREAGRQPSGRETESIRGTQD